MRRRQHHRRHLLPHNTTIRIVFCCCFVFLGLFTLLTFITHQQTHLSTMKTKHHHQITSHFESLTTLEAGVKRLKSIYQQNREWLTQAKGKLQHAQADDFTADTTQHGATTTSTAHSFTDQLFQGGKVCGNNNAKQLILLDQIDLPGGDLSTGPSGATTQEECCLACTNNDNTECIGFTFVLSAKQCWLKKQTKLQRVHNTDTVSGIVPGAEAAMLQDTQEFERLMRDHKEQAQHPQPSSSPTRLHVWPIPQHIQYSGFPRPIHPLFQFILVTSTHKQIQRTLRRYTKTMTGRPSRSDVSPVTTEVNPTALVSLQISCTQCSNAPPMTAGLSEEEKHGTPSSSSYTLHVPASSNSLGNTGTLLCNTYSGLIAGLETLTQICYQGLCNSSFFKIHDAATYTYRGLMLDTGRRFIPVPLLRIVLDLMAKLHLNVLHLHLTDWAAVRWVSEVREKISITINSTIL